jgi:hypothetical protein
VGESKQLLGMGAQLLGDVRTEVSVWIAGVQPGRHCNNGETDDQHTGSDHISGHGALLLINGRDQRSTRIVPY